MDNRIATLSGHLTQTNRQHIKAILAAGLTEGKINRISYQIEHKGLGTYAVKMYVKDRGIVACGGSKLRMSCYDATFTADTPDKWRNQ
jgi:hypothetical protein